MVSYLGLHAPCHVRASRATKRPFDGIHVSWGDLPHNRAVGAVNAFRLPREQQPSIRMYRAQYEVNAGRAYDGEEDAMIGACLKSWDKSPAPESCVGLDAHVLERRPVEGSTLNRDSCHRCYRPIGSW